MADFKLNKDALKKVEKQAQQAGEVAVQRAVERGAGKTPAEAERILKEELRRQGLKPNDKETKKMAKKIAEGG